MRTMHQSLEMQVAFYVRFGQFIDALAEVEKTLPRGKDDARRSSILNGIAMKALDKEDGDLVIARLMLELADELTADTVAEITLAICRERPELAFLTTEGDR